MFASVAEMCFLEGLSYRLLGSGGAGVLRDEGLRAGLRREYQIPRVLGFRLASLIATAWSLNEVKTAKKMEVEVLQDVELPLTSTEGRLGVSMHCVFLDVRSSLPQSWLFGNSGSGLCHSCGCIVVRQLQDLRGEPCDVESRDAFLRFVNYGDRIAVSLNPELFDSTCGEYGCAVGYVDTFDEGKMKFGEGADDPDAFYIYATEQANSSECVKFGDEVVIAWSEASSEGCVPGELSHCVEPGSFSKVIILVPSRHKGGGA